MKAVHHVLREARHAAKIEEERVTADTKLADAICIVGAIGVIGGAAMCAEHYYHLNGDVAYDVATLCGAHPLAQCIKRGLALVRLI